MLRHCYATLFRCDTRQLRDCRRRFRFLMLDADATPAAAAASRCRQYLIFSLRRCLSMLSDA